MFSPNKRSLRLGILETAFGSDTFFFSPSVYLYTFAIRVNQNYLGAEVKTLVNIRTVWRPRGNLQLGITVLTKCGEHDLLTNSRWASYRSEYKTSDPSN